MRWGAALLLLATALGEWASASAIRRSSSFVLPTRGSAHSLTLTTFLTDAADLHYAAVLSGHAPLEAAVIKKAAQSSGVPDGSEDNGILQASTVAVSKAQKVERSLSGLRPNTSYDVYLVAEVPNSNGVYGPVLSVVGAMTHPRSPTISSISFDAVNASSSTVVVSLKLDSPGVVHFALVPSKRAKSSIVSAEDVISGITRDISIAFATERRFRWDLLSSTTAIEDLSSGTEYDALVITEALGDGAVFSDILRLPRTVRTHAAAPDISTLECTATQGSSISVDVSIRLKFDPTIQADSDNSQLFQYQVHYEVMAKGSQHNSTRDFVMRGLIPVQNNGSAFHRNASSSPLHHTIEGLESYTKYDIMLFAETVASNGVVGKSALVENCQTHAEAPQILKAEAAPENGTVHTLKIIAELERPGNIHYLLVPSSSTMSIRGIFRQATSLESLREKISDPGIHVGVISVPNEPPRTVDSLVGGLVANTPYSIVIMPETIDSFGVFGKPYDTILEATTNDYASNVSVVSIEPTFGSLTSLDVRVSMTSPGDILVSCIRQIDISKEECREVRDGELHAVSRSPSEHIFVFTLTDLAEDSEYEVSMFAESRHRTGVKSERSYPAVAKTFQRAPALASMIASPVAARVDAIEITFEINGTAELYFIVVSDEISEVASLENNSTHVASLPLSAELIVNSKIGDSVDGSENKGLRDRHPPPNSHQSEYKLQPTQQIVKVHHIQVESGSGVYVVHGLESNTTYTVHAVTETNGNKPTGVYGVPSSISTRTHEIAPAITKATAHPVPNRTDSIAITVNVTRPGIIHYHLTDTDFSDPTVIQSGLVDEAPIPHVVRGSFRVAFGDMGMEIKNGTNDTQPMDPLVFARNFTIMGLEAATTYLLSLSTESPNSHGVFGEFPAPILVATHSLPPEFEQNSVVVAPLLGSSTALSIQFRIDSIAEVHFALFFRGIVRDRTSDLFEEQENRRIEQQDIDAEAHAQLLRDLNDTSNVKAFVRIPRWPPPYSKFDLKRLTPQTLKDALFEELGEGVWENGTISVSRDDVFRMKTIEKKFEKLPPNAVFDVCLVPETPGSGGVFGSLLCRPAITHADYTNQSILYDEISVKPVTGTTDRIRIQLMVSKLLDNSMEVKRDLPQSARHIEAITGRLPYFILIDGHEGRPDFSHNSFTPNHYHRQERQVSPFKCAIPGRGHVAAVGVIEDVTFENETFARVESTVAGLQQNHRYYFFFAYETAQSDGVFTKINPHKHRPNDTSARHSEAQAIEVTTFEQAPRLSHYEASPTFGNTSSISVRLEVGCVSREDATVHIAVVSDGCSVSTPRILLSSMEDVPTFDMTERIDSQTCDLPLLYKKVDVNLTDSSGGQHHRHHHQTSALRYRTVEEKIGSTGLLRPNTTYQILIATETSGSSGVISDTFKVTRVTTYPEAPQFRQLFVQPRKGSTTELVLVAQLDQPGEVHFMLGVADNSELNVTSAYNISAKALPGERDSKSHNYGRDVVRVRRTIKIDHPDQVHVEVLDYLVAGTSYDVFVVAEGADNSGIYGEIFSFPSVSTFAAPPVLLAHSAYPTRGRTDSLSVGFRVEDNIPCTVHISVIASSLWAPTSHVADGSDTFGNRLAVDERFITRTSVTVEPQANSDDGWHEVNMSVPQPGADYTVFLVTETKGSEGVFGTVAMHQRVRSHHEPPLVLNVSVRPTDARVDALTVDVVLDHDGGAHVHYAVLKHRQRFTRSSISTVGRVDVNASSVSSFVVDGLQGRTSYDVYLRMETFESGGVLGEWAPFPVTATTHGLPAELLESVECDRACEDLGRHPCSLVANVCGECLDGFDGLAGSSNSACQRLEPEAIRPTIKISGVRINPSRQRTSPPLGAARGDIGASVCPLPAGLMEPVQCEDEVRVNTLLPQTSAFSL